MEGLNSALQVLTFRPISEYEEAIPAVMDSIPVLHAHATEATVIVPRESLAANPLLQSLWRAPRAIDAPNTTEDEYVELKSMEVCVTSSTLNIWSRMTSKGIYLSYQSISLHAIAPHPIASAGHVILLQLALPNQYADVTDMYIDPITVSQDVATPVEDDQDDGPLRGMHAAISACSNLHQGPDSPACEAASDFGDDGDDGDDDGDGMPAFAGAWLTGGHHFDEDGNFLAEELGAGAGAVHARDNDEEDEMEDADDAGEGTKRYRLE